MADALIVVESPAKVRTIKKYLGADFDVKASVGHIKDLPKSKLGIDIQKGFEPTYTVIKDKKKVIDDLKKSARKARSIYLAPDPDREGEAIAWHIMEEITGPGQDIYRVLFNDLTKHTILNAIQNPQKLNLERYEAQQTRRILDRLVGYQISPLLWEKVKRGLSAGRVQSVAVRIICEREEEIQNFVTEEYWHITALLEGTEQPSFEARLVKIGKEKARIGDKPAADGILADLAGRSFIIAGIEKKEVKRTPPPPFTTSKLQQEASRRLRFPAKKTMRVAQKLYEGIEIGNEGSVGLITYMRTDSVRIAPEALSEARDFIRKRYGNDYLPQKARVFKTSKSAQDAHEAIRPASLIYAPDNIKQFLSRDEHRLYQLIWNRFVASQMNPEVLDQTTVDITADRYLFKAQGSVVIFPGYTVLYAESRDEENNREKGSSPDAREKGTVLPVLETGEVLSVISIEGEQNFTQPPPRFSEATLVKELEEKGLGRPSTYAAILSTIQDREYVRLDKGRFYPTELGTIVNELLVSNFPRILDVGFTAAMEDTLDRIEEGQATRHETLQNFYAAFETELETAKKGMRNLKREEIPTEHVCNKCGSPMVIKWGRHGRFLACSNYPACRNTANIPSVDSENGTENVTVTGDNEVICDKCGKPMVIKEGKFGRFYGCTGYPECTNTKSIDTGVSCPVEGCGGVLTEKRTRKGKLFFGCSNYPNCTYATWNKPIPEKCPLCDHPFLVEKAVRGKGLIKACPNKGCGYKEEKGE
ncbi:MAG: type I DNA topoisomerase [Deltaproteobacteria bacterium]|nr:type I DNA topoisomerase [Deltaproteobacteria bacterium]